MKQDCHFVPRLILRRYNEKLTLYDLKTEQVKTSSSFNNFFSEKDLYTEEIEKLLGQKIESEFARILDKKIRIDGEKIELSRKEVNVTKKFLLVAMLRVVKFEQYVSYRKDDINKSLKEYFNFEEKDTDRLTDYDYWMRTIKSVLESPSLDEVKNNSNATSVSAYWAQTFHYGYLSIWDSSESGEDFVVIDNGMTSEHEVTKISSIEDDVIKRGYLINQIQNTIHGSYENKLYLKTLFANDFMSENFYTFSITNTRMITIINPFYRLYFKEKGYLKKPDIWPTKIRDESLFKKNDVKYVDQSLYDSNGKINANDIFIYPIRKMKLEDVIYVNALSLDRISNIVGFADSKRIQKSLSVYSLLNNKRKNYESLEKYFEDIENQIIKSKTLKQIKEDIETNYISPIDFKYIDIVLHLKNK